MDETSDHCPDTFRKTVKKFEALFCVVYNNMPLWTPHPNSGPNVFILAYNELDSSFKLEANNK